MNSPTYDAIVVGGGPAGATTAAVLAQHNRRVLLLEREVFPRYHVGESLMPRTWFTFERLGVLDWLKQSGSPLKHSVQFVSTSGKVSQPFYFFKTIEHEYASTWQILRSDFDKMMLEMDEEKKFMKLRLSGVPHSVDQQPTEIELPSVMLEVIDQRQSR